MEENIFEGANFGDKFVTRDGQIMRYVNLQNVTFLHAPINNTKIICCYYDNDKQIHQYKLNGEQWGLRGSLDIVSRYQESIDAEELQKNFEECKQTVKFLVDKYCKPIDEKELDSLSLDYAEEIDDKYVQTHPNENWSKKFVEYHWQDLADAFKAGYRKAKETL